MEGTHHAEFLLRVPRVRCFSPPVCSRRFCRRRNAPSLHGFLCRPTVQSLNICTWSQPQNWPRGSESLPSIPEFGPVSARRPLYSLCHVAGASAAGSPCLLVEFCQQAFCVSPGGPVHSVNPRLVLLRFLPPPLLARRLRSATSTSITSTSLAEISDLLRQFRDVCLQIINASSQLQHDLAPNPFRRGLASHQPLCSASTAESFLQTHIQLFDEDPYLDQRISSQVASNQQEWAVHPVGLRGQEGRESFLRCFINMRQIPGPESFLFVRALTRCAKWRSLASAPPSPHLAASDVP